MILVIESLNVFQPMVRPNFTNCFQTKTAEDLENKIVYVLSEQVKIKLISNFGGQYCFKDKSYKSILLYMYLLICYRLCDLCLHVNILLILFRAIGSSTCAA
jgi:hypothetical protein